MTDLGWAGLRTTISRDEAADHGHAVSASQEEMFSRGVGLKGRVDDGCG